MPYEDGMAVIVRAELPNGVKKCTTVKVAGMEDGAERFIVDLMTAGKIRRWFRVRSRRD